MAGFSPYSKVVPFPMEDLTKFFNEKYNRALVGQELVMKMQDQLSQNVVRPWIEEDVQTKNKLIDTTLGSMMETLKKYNYNLEQAGPQINMMRKQVMGNPFWAASAENARKALEAGTLEKQLSATLRQGESLYKRNEDVLNKPTIDESGNIADLDYEYKVNPTAQEILDALVKGKIGPDTNYEYLPPANDPYVYPGQRTSQIPNMGIIETTEQVNRQKYNELFNDPQTVQALVEQYPYVVEEGLRKGQSLGDIVERIKAFGESMLIPKSVKGDPFVVPTTNTNSRGTKTAEESKTTFNLPVQMPLAPVNAELNYPSLQNDIVSLNKAMVDYDTKQLNDYEQKDGKWYVKGTDIPADDLKEKDNYGFTILDRQLKEKVDLNNQLVSSSILAHNTMNPGNLISTESKKLFNGQEYLIPKFRELTEEESQRPPQGLVDYVNSAGRLMPELVEMTADISSMFSKKSAQEIKDEMYANIENWKEGQPFVVKPGTPEYLMKQMEVTGFDKTVKSVYDQTILPEIEQPQQMAYAFNTTDKESPDYILTNAVVNNWNSFPKMREDGTPLTPEETKRFFKNNEFQNSLYTKSRNILPTKYWFDEGSGKWLAEVALMGSEGQYNIYAPEKRGQETSILDITDQMNAFLSPEQKYRTEFVHEVWNTIPSRVNKTTSIELNDKSFYGADDYLGGSEWKINVIKRKGSPNAYKLQKKNADGSYGDGISFDNKNQLINSLYDVSSKIYQKNAIEERSQIDMGDAMTVASTAGIDPYDQRTLAALQTIATEEGVHLNPYKDTKGIWTSGVGFANSQKKYDNRSDVMNDFGQLLPTYTNVIPGVLANQMRPGEYAAVLDFLWNNGQNSGTDLINAMSIYINNGRNITYLPIVKAALMKYSKGDAATERRNREYQRIQMANINPNTR